MAKKALILTVALLCAFAVPAMAQQKKAATGDKKPVSMAPATGHADVSDFGTRWQGMSEKERESFLLGMGSAFRVVCMNAASGDGTNKDVLEANKRFKECMLTFMPYQISVIKASMTSLYQDKANNQMPFDMLYGVALLKAGEKPYEDSLMQLRKVAASMEKGAK